MIDPAETLEQQVARQSKIIDALIRRANREHGVGGSVYSLFQSAIALQGEVWEKTRDLEQALDTLGRASNKLKIAEYAWQQTEQNLAEALEAMEGGFALFSEGKLEVFNDQFKTLVPDLEEEITNGLELDTYFELLRSSASVVSVAKTGRKTENAGDNGSFSLDRPSVLELRGDRWFQITRKSASANRTVLLSTEITRIVRQNRLEKNRLIDEQSFFLQAAFDHMTQGVCTFSEEGTLLITNERFRELLNLPLFLVQKGTAIRQILEFARKQRLLVGLETGDDFDEFLHELRSRGSIDTMVRHVNGNILNIRVHGLPDKGYIMNVLDITAETHSKETLEQMVQERTRELTAVNERLRRQNEEQAIIDEQLRQAKAEAEEAVSSKTKFFAAASHDLLQPINAAKLLISTLGEGTQDTPFEDTVSRLGRSFDSIESLLHALLDISRLDSVGSELSISSFCIGDLLSSVRDDYARLAREKGIDLSIVPCRHWVQSDRRYLLRSLQNLVVNAIQYTETGRILAGCRRKHGLLVLEVIDTGIGISPEDQTRIFSEFTRVSEQSSDYGMGLGLSIVERACRRLGHPLSVSSTVGKGSRFSITLPFGQVPDELPVGLAEEHDTHAEAMDLIVLIIEDNEDVLFATAQKVESWGGSVLTASSTAQAVEQVREIGMAPDIILADYQLTGSDNGVEAIKAVRRQTSSRVPAIIITASPPEELEEASRKQAFTVLSKPVKLSSLRSLMDWKTRQPKIVCFGT